MLETKKWNSFYNIASSNW